jgi:hypothetical protein
VGVFGAEFYRMDFMSDARAVEFLKKAHQNTLALHSSGKLAFKLTKPSSAGGEVFGEITYDLGDGDGTFAINFADGGCIINGESLCNIGNGKFSMNEPFLGNLVFCPRDLHFIFVGDDKLSYVSPARISGRTVQQFLRTAKFSVDGVYISNVRISVDEKLMVILQVDFLDNKRIPVRRITVNSFKNFDGIWLPKVIEICNFVKYERAKLEVLSAKSGM